MAITENTFTGNGSNLGPFSFTFKWLESTDIKVTVGGVLKTAGTHYNLQALNYTTKDGGQVLFTAGNAPANNAAIRIYRDTDDSTLSATFFSGSAIRAQDLNDNFLQNLYISQESENNVANAVAGQIPDGSIGTVQLADGAVNDSKVSSIGSPKVTFTQAGTGAVQRTAESKLKDVISVKDFGAIGDGVANDTAAINAAVAAANKQAVLLPKGTYNVSGVNTSTWPALISMGGVGLNKTDGTLFPKGYWNLAAGPVGSTIYGRKYLAPGDFVDIGSYTNPLSSQVYLENWSQGASSPSRGQVAQVYLTSSQLNNGADHYNVWCSMGVYNNQTPGHIDTDWGTQNSGGLFNGQINALTNKVNLFGSGDVVLDDTGKQDVSMLGSVYFVYYNGTESGSYNLPRIIHLGSNLGTKHIDAIFAGTGRTYVGLDLSRTITTGAAIALADNHKIAWNATSTVPTGKFSTQNVGTAFTFYQSGYYYFQDAGVNAATLKYSDNAFYGGQSTSILRAHNTTNNKSVAAGVVDDYGYLVGSAASGDCGLILRNTVAGTTSDRMVFNGNLVLPGSNNTQDFGASNQKWSNSYSTNFRPGAGSVIWTSGVGTPEGAVTAPVGSLFTRTDGGTNTTFYVKESGTGNTGWVAK